MTFTRRRFIQATGAGAAALGMPTIAQSQTGAIRVGLMTVKTARSPQAASTWSVALVQYLKERKLHDGRPKGRALRRRQRRRSGAVAHQAPGAGRARQDPDHDRAARHRLGARIGRLHPQRAAAHAVGRGRRGTWTQRKPIPGSPAETSTSSQSAHAACRLLLQDAQVPAHGDDRR